MVKWCHDCKKPHHYPRGICPHCMSSNLEWKQAKGTGEIYTYSIMHAAKPAYVIAYVTLEEGVTMMTNIVDIDPAQRERRPEGEGRLQTERRRRQTAVLHTGLTRAASDGVRR